MKIICIVLFFSFHFVKINAQSSSIYSLKQVTNKYANGKIKSLENLIIAKCRGFDYDMGDTIVFDSHRYGAFKQYYENGRLKLSGQYDCKSWNNDTISKILSCFKTGLWYEFDSLGKQTKVSLYDEDYLVFDKYPSKKDTLNVLKDSMMLKLERYEIKNSYLIKRYKKNKRLFIKFPVYSDHNYWYLFQKPLSTLIDIESRKNEYKELRLLRFIKNDDTPKNKDFMDFSNLKSGIYYIVYRTIGRYFYEVEIILEDVDE